MFSSQAREFYKFIIKHLTEFEPEINDLLNFTSSMKGKEDALLSKILNNQGGDGNSSNLRTQAVADYIRAYNAGIASFKSSFRSIDFARKYNALEDAIKKYIFLEGISASEIDDLIALFNNFMDTVQTFQQNDSDANSRIALFSVSTEICNSFRKIIDSYSWFIKNLEEEKQALNEDKEMLLEIKLMGVEFGVDEFAEKIKAINDLYERLADELPDENEKITPMRIVKIESGTIDFSVICNQVIGELIVLIIVGTVTAMIKWHNDKKEKLPKKQQEEVVKKVLRDCGVEEKSSNRENIGLIQKKALEITSKFITIKINKETYSYTGSDVNALPFFQKLIESGDESRSETESD